MTDSKYTHVFLSLGSNLGNRKQHIEDAIYFLKYIINDIKASSLYETVPLYIEDQPKFLNMVISGLTYLKPEKLLESTQDIENKIGRKVKGRIKNGPRIIDIDILLLNNLILSTKRLIIPHPGIKNRLFVLIPLLEIEPDLKDPVTGKPFSIFRKELNNQGITYFSKVTS